MLICVILSNNNNNNYYYYLLMANFRTAPCLCFKTRLSVKLFLSSLIQIQCKTHFHKKDFALSLVFES